MAQQTSVGRRLGVVGGSGDGVGVGGRCRNRKGTTDLEAFPADTWADQQAAGLHSETWAQEEPGCFGDGHHSALS